MEKDLVKNMFVSLGEGARVVQKAAKPLVESQNDEKDGDAAMKIERTIRRILKGNFPLLRIFKR